MKEFVDVFPDVLVVKHPPAADLRYCQIIRAWCEEQNINYSFLNHWSDEKGTFSSVKITNEEQRFWFKIRFV